MKFSLIGAWMLWAIAPLVLHGCIRLSSNTPPAVVPESIAAPAQAPSTNPASPEEKPAAGGASEAAIWSQLRQGTGYVVLFRHALAPGTGDPANFRLDDCSTQRNLSAAGRQQAIRIGEGLRQQGIVISRVLSSQWCRCLETAQLMDVGRVEPFPLLNSFFQDRSTEGSQTQQLRQFILENRDATGITIMVTHQVNITSISGIVPQSGAAVVLQASTPEQIEVIGQLTSFDRLPE